MFSRHAISCHINNVIACHFNINFKKSQCYYRMKYYYYKCEKMMYKYLKYFKLDSF